MISENDYSNTQNDFDNLSAWSMKWRMKCNVDKSKLMYFGNRD